MIASSLSRLKDSSIPTHFPLPAPRLSFLPHQLLLILDSSIFPSFPITRSSSVLPSSPAATHSRLIHLPIISPNPLLVSLSLLFSYYSFSTHQSSHHFHLLRSFSLFPFFHTLIPSFPVPAPPLSSPATTHSSSPHPSSRHFTFPAPPPLLSYYAFSIVMSTFFSSSPLLLLL